jgi:hypothetical protein
MQEKPAPAIFDLDTPKSDIFNLQLQTGGGSTLTIPVLGAIS